MNRRPLIVFLFASSLSVSLPATLAEAAMIPAPIIISEIQVDGKDSAGKTVGEDEFIELYNKAAETVSLAGFKLCRKTSGTTTSQIKSFSAGDSIAGSGYFLFANSEGIFGSFADAKTKSSPLAKNNSIALADDCSTPTLVIDSIAWGSGKKFDDATTLVDNPLPGHSLLYDLTSLFWSETATPSPRASSGDSPPPPDPPTSTAIRINEIFPNPKAKSDSGEFVELYNFGSEEVDISGWTLRDATKTGKYIFPSGTSIIASGYLVITDQSFKVSLNNTDETVSLSDKTETLIDTVRYEKTKEDVSLNYTRSGWRGGTPTPGSANILNSLPETDEKVPKKGFKNTALSFRARGDDADNDTLKYAWDFGDGHKSYKAAPTHIYEKNGTYSVTLKTTDGKDDVTEMFTIKISSYDPPEVRITALSPNPAGSDTDNEWLSIENREKKTVNLKGFSIATGWKALINHPIREDFFIPPKQEVKLTRTDALFTLPNQKGKIELRAPDGEVLQKIRYQLEKSLAEESIYTKEKGRRWIWQDAPPAAARQTARQTLIEKNDAGLDQEAMPPETREATEPAVIPAAETEEILQQKVLGATASRTSDTDKKLWQFLSSGTRVQIPDSVSLDPDAVPREPSPVPLEEHYAVSFVKTSLLNINTELNAFIGALK